MLVSRLVACAAAVAGLGFTAQARAQTPQVPSEKSVGGHVGIAVPIVTVSDETTTIADQLTLLHPIGIGFKVAPRWAVDFETVVSVPIKQDGAANGLVVDPGVIYDWGGVATGLRVAWQINAPANIGLIPLVNVGIVKGNGVAWFVEAAFPTFYSDENVAFNAVLHTGVGF